MGTSAVEQLGGRLALQTDFMDSAVKIPQHPLNKNVVRGPETQLLAWEVGIAEVGKAATKFLAQSSRN